MSASILRFTVPLHRPSEPNGATWTFLVLPKVASARLPARSMTTVEGRFAGQPFQATLEPDGDGSHWLKVEKALRDAVGVAAGDTVELVIAPMKEEPEPVVPPDIHKALSAAPEAKAVWTTLTPIARRDWIHWMTSGKKAETRMKRIATACDMLASGKRRACCFDRSGMYSKGNMGAPMAKRPLLFMCPVGHGSPAPNEGNVYSRILTRITKKKVFAADRQDWPKPSRSLVPLVSAVIRPADSL